ncbi:MULTISPECIES: lytic transglycosylase [unclassified Marinimicrobium]|mgnify:FL=1|jgi:membrane-bound lytic murein transglycosylase D|uniref:lytic transglycosylase n=1 Tax=unclassified Marinimicrobium TaxID=2632100 RepID=UPI000C667637|nr:MULTISPECIES: LysM peptidoglycan-binding domain-containing protein [unclassified Marinimicrobium]MAN51989.1 lytic transglycosylase [Marinimicrobium sp.]
MNRLKRPLALAVSLISLGGCQTLTPSEPSKTADQNHLLIDESLCTLDREQQAQFLVSDEGNLWPRLRDGYGLPDVDHPRIDTYVDWYARHPHYMERVIERGQRFLHHIANELEAEDMPLELALLPIVESAFDPFAYSHGRASGIWQFVPATGRQYGLKQNWWYDGRRDVVASTDAAIRYLKYLNELFDGDWLLALASYNTGQGNVMRRIRSNERRGKPTDFWSLNLPRETRAYVPQLLALARVIGEPEKYNLALNPVPDEPYFRIVDVESQIDLAQAAELAELELDELYLLNAGYNRWATDPDGPHRLLIPVQHEETFRANLASIPTRERVGWDRYRVVSGDSLITIARRYRTSVDTIKSVNQLNSNIIRAGQTLMIPTAKHPANRYAFSADQRRQRTQNRSQGSEGSTRVDYQVRPGDSFWTIAKRHGITVGALTNWNGMAPGDTLMPGQTLVIWTEQQDMTSSAQGDRRSVVRKVHYRVRKGDSIARIANRFNLSVQDILRWNTVSASSYIHPGQSLTLFVDVTNNASF